MLTIDPPMPDGAPTKTVVEMIREAARRDPDALALVCGPSRIRWSELDARINKVANALLARGLKPGDNVAILSLNSVAYVEVFLGVVRAGGCITPLSTMAAPGALEKMVTDCGAGFFFLSQTYRELAGPACEVPGITRIALDFEEAGFEPYAAMLDKAEATDPMVPVALKDPFNLIYSSGTTGTPKGILHDHRMRAAQMDRVEANGYDDNARTLLSTPLYSNTTIVAFLPTLVGGSTVVLMPKFDAQAWLELAEAERITHTMLVPVQYKRIMENPNFDQFDLSSMRVKFSTSAPLRAALKADVLKRFPGKLAEYYGLTEGGGVTVLVADEHPSKLHTVGRPVEGCEIRLIDEAGQEVAPGAVGEIVGRSPTMMAGYFGRTDLTADYIWRDELGRMYFRSGDMGRFDEDGFLILSDRKKDMIISGGLNIYADDLELVLLGDPAVSDAAVIGVPSDDWGETPVGIVVLRADAGASAEDIRKRANAQLGKSQRLAAVHIADSLPRSSVGKVLKRDLREQYAGAPVA